MGATTFRIITVSKLGQLKVWLHAFALPLEIELFAVPHFCIWIKILLFVSCKTTLLRAGKNQAFYKFLSQFFRTNFTHLKTIFLIWAIKLGEQHSLRLLFFNHSYKILLSKNVPYLCQLFNNCLMPRPSARTKYFLS